MVDDRHDSGKADGALRRPVNHAGGDSAGLGDQRQIFRSRHMRGKACVETDAEHHFDDLAQLDNGLASGKRVGRNGR